MPRASTASGNKARTLRPLTQITAAALAQAAQQLPEAQGAVLQLKQLLVQAENDFATGKDKAWMGALKGTCAELAKQDTLPESVSQAIALTIAGLASAQQARVHSGPIKHCLAYMTSNDSRMLSMIANHLVLLMFKDLANFANAEFDEHNLAAAASSQLTSTSAPTAESAEYERSSPSVQCMRFLVLLKSFPEVGEMVLNSELPSEFSSFASTGCSGADAIATTAMTACSQVVQWATCLLSIGAPPPTHLHVDGFALEECLQAAASAANALRSHAFPAASPRPSQDQAPGSVALVQAAHGFSSSALAALFTPLPKDTHIVLAAAAVAIAVPALQAEQPAPAVVAARLAHACGAAPAPGDMPQGGGVAAALAACADKQLPPTAVLALVRGVLNAASHTVLSSNVTGPTGASVTLLSSLLTQVLASCSAVDVVHRMQALRTLELWLKVAQGSLAASGTSDLSAVLPRADSALVLDALLLNWGHPSRLISGTMGGLLKQFLKLDAAAAPVVDGVAAHGVGTLAGQLLQQVALQPMQMKGKYYALQSLIDVVGAKGVQGGYPALMQDMLDTVTARCNMEKPALAVLASLLECSYAEMVPKAKAKKSKPKQKGSATALEQTQAIQQRQHCIEAWRASWRSVVLEALLGPHAVLRDRVVAMLLPPLVKVDGGCLAPLLDHVAGLAAGDAGADSTADHASAFLRAERESPDALDAAGCATLAHVALLKMARKLNKLAPTTQEQLFGTHDMDEMREGLKWFLPTAPAWYDSDAWSPPAPPSSGTAAGAGEHPSADAVHSKALRRALRHADPELRLQALELVAGGMGQHGPTLTEMGLVAQYLAEFSTVEQSEVLKRLSFIVESLLRRVDEAARPAMRRVRWLADLTAAVQAAGAGAVPGAVLRVQETEIELTAAMLTDLNRPKEDHTEWLVATACGRFVAWLLRAAAAGMYPGAPAERAQPAAMLLQAAAPLAAQWHCTAHASPTAQSGRFPCVCAAALSGLLQPPVVAQLFQSCDSSWEPVRTAACDVLAALPAPLPGMETPAQVAAAASRALVAIASPRAREAEAGALQLLTLHRVYVQGLGWPLHLLASGQCAVADSGTSSPADAATGMVRSLCDEVLRRAGSLARTLRQHGLEVPIAQDAPAAAEKGASGTTPPLLHGLLLALSHIVRSSPLAVLRTAQTGSDAAAAATQWRTALAHVLSACAAAHDVAMVVVADTAEEDGDVVGGPPDQASARVEEGVTEDGQVLVKGRVDCRGHLLVGSSETGAAGGGQGGDGGLQHESTHDENPLHLLVVGAWQIIKESTNCVATVLEQAPLGDASRGGLVSIPQAQATGDSMLSALLTLKHMGGVLHASHGFSRLCRVLLGSTAPGARACVEQWLASLLHRVAAKHQQFILRRSAGFAMAFLAIVRAEAAAAGHSQPLIDTAVSHLLVHAAGEEGEQVAMRAALLQLGVAESQLPAPGAVASDGGRTTMWRRQVHARNVLRAIARDGAVARRLGRFLPLALSQALGGFASPSWALRNSSLMVFSTVVTALVGSKRVDEAASEQNLRSARQLFAAYPSLQDMLAAQLEGGVQAVLGGGVIAEDPTEGGPAPTLYPLLLLLGRLSADEGASLAGADAAHGSGEEDEEGDVTLGGAAGGAAQASPFGPLLRQLAASPQLWVRRAAGAALASLTPLAESAELLDSLSSQLQQCVSAGGKGSSNTAHGVLLQMRSVLNKFLYASSGTFKHAWRDVVKGVKGGSAAAPLSAPVLSAVLSAGKTVLSSVLETGHAAPVVATAALQVLCVAWHVALRAGSSDLGGALGEAAGIAANVLSHGNHGAATAPAPGHWAGVKAALQAPAPCTALAWIAPLTSALSTAVMLSQLAQCVRGHSTAQHDALCVALGRGLTHPQPEVRCAMGKCARRIAKALHDFSAVGAAEANEATPLLSKSGGGSAIALLAAMGDVLRDIAASEQHEGVMRFVFRALRVCVAGSSGHGSWDAHTRGALTSRCLAVASSARNSKLRNHALLLAAWCVSRPAAPLAHKQGMAGIAAAVASAACDSRSFVARIAAARALHMTAGLWAAKGGSVAPSARVQAWGTLWGLLNDEDAEVRDAALSAATSQDAVPTHAPLGGMVQLLLQWVGNADVPAAAAMGMLFALACSGLSNEHLAQRQAAAMDEAWGTPAWLVQRMANDPQLEVVAPVMGVPPSALRVAVRLARDTYAEFAQRSGSDGPVQASNNATRVFQPEGNNEHSESIVLVWHLVGGMKELVKGGHPGAEAAATALKRELAELQQGFDLTPGAQQSYCHSTDRVTRELAHAYLRNMNKLQAALA